jgi:hypothetical protein
MMSYTQPMLCLTRACSGWPQHSGDDSKIYTTADAQAVVRTGLTRDGCDRMRHHLGSRRLAASPHPGQNTLKHNVYNVSVQ